MLGSQILCNEEHACGHTAPDPLTAKDVRATANIEAAMTCDIIVSFFHSIPAVILSKCR